MGAGGGEELLAMGREEGLVGGDDGLPVAEGGEDGLAGGGGAAHQLDDDMDGRVVHDGLPVLHEEVGRDVEAAGALGVAHGDGGHGHAKPEACGQEVGTFGQGLEHGSADRPAAQQPEVHLLHHGG